VNGHVLDDLRVGGHRPADQIELEPQAEDEDEEAQHEARAESPGRKIELKKNAPWPKVTR
jgi:hypothetical protein